MYDIRQIEEQVKKVLSYSQDIPYDLINADDLIKNWIKNKNKFIEKFNNNLTLELGKITFKLSEEEKKKKVDIFCESIEYDYPKLSEFIFVQRDGFYNNLTIKDYITENNIFIKKGTKIVKAFKYFIDDKDKLHNLQSEASMMIQNDKVSGELCFSVHPLDFLSSSENACHWRSCHSLDGDYRAGNLEYMTDKTTFLCYLKGEENVKLSNFPEDVLWNNKKWRELFFINEQDFVIWAGRQYPFFSDEALEIIRKKINSIFYDKGCGIEKWVNDEIIQFGSREYNYLEDSYVCINNRLYPKHSIVIPNKNHLHFNDILSSTCYRPYYSYSREKFRRREAFTKFQTPIIDDIIKTEIGHSVNCICCGKRHINQDASMICTKCTKENKIKDDNYCYCEICGKYIRNSEAIIIENDNCDYITICESCAINNCVVCNNCCKVILEENAYYDEETGMYKCKKCKEIEEQ